MVNSAETSSSSSHFLFRIFLCMRIGSDAEVSLRFLHDLNDAVAPAVEFRILFLTFVGMRQDIIQGNSDPHVKSHRGSHIWYRPFEFGIVEDHRVGFIAKQGTGEIKPIGIPGSPQKIGGYVIRFEFHPQRVGNRDLSDSDDHSNSGLPATSPPPGSDPQRYMKNSFSPRHIPTAVPV